MTAAVRGARVLVFEDSVYRREDGAVTTDRAFLHFVTGLVERGLTLTLMGRVDPTPSRSYYAVPSSVRVVALPHYPSLMDPSVPWALVRSLRRAWTALGTVEVAWLMGPHPLSWALLLLARVRGVPVVLGVRQDLPTYARQRRPGQRWSHRAADVLEAGWRRAARSCAVVAVGPELSRHYAHAARLLPLDISLVPAAEVGSREPPPWEDELVLFTVGRLEQEKNPLLLADVLALLRRDDPRWRLRVCGIGSLEGALRDRLEELGLSAHADLLGYVPVNDGLLEQYRRSHVFLHVSWTEGLPQVLFEAWSAGVPVVATEVGGVAEAAAGAALLIPAGDAEAAAAQVRRLAADPQLRERMVVAGAARLEARSMEKGLERLAEFLQETVGTRR